LSRNKETLCKKNIWIFSSGPTGLEKPIDITKGWLLPAKQKQLIDIIQPVGIEIFHGNLDRKHMNLFEKFIIKKVNTPFGDFRVWDDIRSWSSSIGKFMLNNKKND